jgi:hypothetical protein
LDKAGLLSKINAGVITIYQGRQWLDTEGLEGDGRISYKTGLAIAMEAFKEVCVHAAEDLELLFLAEYTFLIQELNLCAPADTNAKTSLMAAIHEFDEGFLAFGILQKAENYKPIHEALSTRTEFRYRGMPKDAFHVACAGHYQRITNSLKVSGINPAEKRVVVSTAFQYDNGTIGVFGKTKGSSMGFIMKAGGIH